MSGAASQIVAEYDYRDENGATLFQVRRKLPKAFVQRATDGNGGWREGKGCMDGVRRVLYRLPELLAADPSRPVFVVEGEKDADALCALGLVATTNPGGVKKWRREYGEHLRGRDTVILPDNDDTGRDHAAHVRKMLKGFAKSARVIELPGLPPKGDVSNWIEAGGTAVKLLQLTATHVWRSAKFDFPVTPTGKVWSQDGKEYAEVITPEDGVSRPVPKDELVAASRDDASDDTDDGADADGAKLSDAEAEAEVERLAALPQLRYARQRTASAKMLGIPPGMLDRLVRDARGDNDSGLQGKAPEFPAPEPWAQSVDGAKLLGAMARYFTRHAVLPQGAHHALALWCIHCAAFDLFALTPRLQITAATKEAGKSTLLELVKGVVLKPLETEGVSESAMFRVIAQHRPTLLLDEGDTLLRDRPDLCRIVNAGNKPGGSVLRVEGENLEVRAFDVHAPMAIAGIGRLPGTIESRCIRVAMQRRRRSEVIRPIDDRTRALAAGLCRKAARWVSDHADKLRAARPDMGDLINRRADLWRPLYAIADAAGGDWPALARAAQATLAAGADNDADSLGEQLLADLRDVFNEWVAEQRPATARPEDATEMESAEIVNRLTAMEGRPWADLPGRRPGPLTTARLARLLKPFGIRPGDIGPEDARKKGYKILAFADAFERHLP